MQQQLDALNQDENVRNQKTITAPSRSSTRRSEGSGGRRKVRKDNEGESSSTNIPTLQDTQLTRKVEEVIQKAKTRPRKEEERVMEASLPFVSKILETEILTKFKLPPLPVFDGVGNSIIHITSYHNKMILQNVNNVILCRVFPSTLTDIAQNWLHQLPQNSVSSFDDLAEKFRTRFITNIPPTKSIHDLRVCRH